jgi:PIN domain nuclease of toxin-antitoxin system
MIVMDTHIWLWWVNGNFDLLGKRRLDMLEQHSDLAVRKCLKSFKQAFEA